MSNKNRGKQPNDDKIFAPKWLPIFKEAVNDLCYLITKNYNSNSATQIVGNRYKLNKRQQKAIYRVSSGDHQNEIRHQKEMNPAALNDQIIAIDGFNILILLENALSGAYIFKGRDGTYRDISSVHGSYKRVIKTKDAILLVGNTLKALNIKSAIWYLDRPISNSGLLKTQLSEISTEHEFNWDVRLVYSPDKVLAESEHVAISSDGWILDNVERWFNLGAYIIENEIKETNTLVL